MPTTAENVSMIKNHANTFSRIQVLQVLDEVQKIVYSNNCDQTQYITSETGMPPFLRTRGGHRRYRCPSTCRETAAVFSSKPPERMFGSRYSVTRDSYYNGSGSGGRTFFFQGVPYYEFPVTTRPAAPGQLATVRFPFDPGTTTNTYYHLFYLQPTTLEDESVNMMIPEHLHYHLRRAVLSILRSELYGETGVEYNVVKIVEREIRNQLNRGKQGKTFRVPIQLENQNTGYAGSWPKTR